MAAPPRANGGPAAAVLALHVVLYILAIIWIWAMGSLLLLLLHDHDRGSAERGVVPHGLRNYPGGQCAV